MLAIGFQSLASFLNFFFYPSCYLFRLGGLILSVQYLVVLYFLLEHVEHLCASHFHFEMCASGLEF